MQDKARVKPKWLQELEQLLHTPRHKSRVSPAPLRRKRRARAKARSKQARLSRRGNRRR